MTMNTESMTDADKAAALDKIAAAEGAFCITESAKVLKMRPGELFSKLEGDGWIAKASRKGRWKPNQSKVSAGLIDGETRLTPKGLMHVALAISQGAATAT